jgi:hypothetical protein
MRVQMNTGSALGRLAAILLWLAAALMVVGCGGGASGDAMWQPRARAQINRNLPDFRHMRAVHMMGNWLGNTQGFQEPLLAGAGSLTASHVDIQGVLSTYTDAAGVSHTNDLALVTLTGVQVGTVSLATAGFWVFRDVSTGMVGVQFRPSLDAHLAAVSGFSGDVNVTMAAGDATPSFSQVATTTGDARALVLAVLAHAPELVATASATLAPGAVLGSPATLSALLATMRDALGSQDERFFSHLKSMNVEWIGISVAMHYDSYSDPTVRTRVCAAGYIDSGGNYNSCAFPDSDLTSFIARARAHGLHVYLTLAFESSGDLDATPSPACNTPSYRMARWWLGVPALPAGSAVSKCIPASQWWWNPSHPDYAAKVQAFWSSYQTVAVKYATLAQAAGVELFSLGTETDGIFRTRAGSGNYTNDFAAQLLSMVAAVRSVYSGAVTYDQHFSVWERPDTVGGAAATQHLFDDLDLDVVGISAYFTLESAPPDRVLSIAELESDWEAVFQSFLEPARSIYPRRPIVFTEIGYTDDVNSPFNQQAGATQPEPAHAAGTPTPGMVQQANIYQALFNVNARHGDLVAGTFFWGNDYFPYNAFQCGVIDWSLYCNEPAREVVTSAYAQWRRADADRTFAWAAANYPQLFKGSSSTGAQAGYYYRYYPETATYLGLLESSGEVYVHNGREYNFLDVGPLRTYLDAAGRAGY